MYANSRFAKDVDEWGQVKEWIQPGDKISQSDLGVSDEEWQAIIDAKAVVEYYPKGLDSQTPPAEYYRSHGDEEEEEVAEPKAEPKSEAKSEAPPSPPQAESAAPLAQEKK